jgi:hypothetical protein
MARDIKLNNYQHTPKKLRNMCTLYMATCDLGSRILPSPQGDEKEGTSASPPTATTAGAPPSGEPPKTTAKKTKRKRRKNKGEQ